MTTPLRIGILGAARIADDGIVDPAKVLGHELVAVGGIHVPGAAAGHTGYVVQLELIDACYRGAGLSPRGT
jgi:predicted homoserine dehydrogenase-like protein